MSKKRPDLGITWLDNINSVTKTLFEHYLNTERIIYTSDYEPKSKGVSML